MIETIPDCFYRISIKALILDEQQRFLLIQEHNGLRELPGGGLDFGETPEEGIKRELAEEMGLTVTTIATQPSYFYTTTSLGGKNIANVVYKTTVEHLHFTPSDECVAIGFFSAEEASQLATFPNVQVFATLYIKD